MFGDVALNRRRGSTAERRRSERVREEKQRIKKAGMGESESMESFEKNGSSRAGQENGRFKRSMRFLATRPTTRPAHLVEGDAPDAHLVEGAGQLRRAVLLAWHQASCSTGQ